MACIPLASWGYSTHGSKWRKHQAHCISTYLLLLWSCAQSPVETHQSLLNLKCISESKTLLCSCLGSTRLLCQKVHTPSARCRGGCCRPCLSRRLSSLNRFYTGLSIFQSLSSPHTCLSCLTCSSRQEDWRVPLRIWPQGRKTHVRCYTWQHSSFWVRPVWSSFSRLPSWCWLGHS